MTSDVRNDFPLLINSDVIYFDNAATTQKPECVLRASRAYYENDNANPLRGLYDLSVRATEAYESSREQVRAFVGAASADEIIFTRNTTESLNLVAFSYGSANVGKGDEIVVSISEHHSNILPWQSICRRNGATLKYLYVDNYGHISDEEIARKITARTKIVAVAQVSNVLGQRNPIEKIIAAAHSVGAVVIVDAAQSVPHMSVDVVKLDCDFLAFSGHKMLAPMGIGVLYGKKRLLDNMEPFLTGGEMIDSVTEQDAVFAPVPQKFEAGTVNCSGAVGLAEAIRYIDKLGFQEIEKREAELVRQIVEGMSEMPEIEIIGSGDWHERHGIVSFNVRDVHPHDAASILNDAKIAVRAGHHCAQPLLKHLGCSSCLRASVYFYNTSDEVERFLDALKSVRGWLGYGS